MPKTTLTSVAKGPKKIVWGRENLGPNFWQIYQKGAELFCSLVLH
jgi:hypothetical protein